MTQTPGLDILNCGAGHVEVRFDNNDPMELARASRIITDMLARGYVLFIHGEGNALVRVESFDATKGVYLIADLNDLKAEDREAIQAAQPQSEFTEATAKKGRGRPRKSAEVPVGAVKTTAIARSAGG